MNNTDPLKFVQGCDNKITSPFTLNGETLKSYDKNKLLKILKGMTQREIDSTFTAISNLIHNEVTREGLWATDKTPQEIAEAFHEVSTLEERIVTAEELMFQLD